MAEKEGLERGRPCRIFAETVCVEWTNVLIYKFLKVQKTLGISWSSPDSREERRYKIIINSEILFVLKKR